MECRGEEVVRRVGVEHASKLAEILRKSFAEFEGKLDPPSGALFETTESIIKLLELGGAFAVFVHDQPVACVFFRPESGHLYLYRLGVLPAYRRLGLGTLLIDCVETEGRIQGFRRIKLGTRLALPENIAYYEKLGYVRREDGVHPSTKKPFYAVMEKELSLETNSSSNSVSGA